MGHVLSFGAGVVVGGLVVAAGLILWAVRGSRWLVTGK